MKHVSTKQQTKSDQSQSHKLDAQGADTDRVIFYSYQIRVEGEDREYYLDTITPTIEGVRDRLSNMIPETTLTSIEQLKKTCNDEENIEYMEGDILDRNGIVGCPVCKKLDSSLCFANAGQIVSVYLCTIHRYAVAWCFESAHFLHPENIYDAGLCINYEDLVESGFKDEEYFSCE